MAIKLVTRAEWGARPPKKRSSAHLGDRCTHHWEGPPMRVNGQPTWDHSKCASLVRGIQNFHMDGRGWSDIAYNFLVCQHGYTFEGRGLNVINAANGTNVGNKTSHAICSVAGEGNPWPMEERIGVRDTVEYIVGHAPAQPGVRPHSDWHSTDCDGDERRAWDRAGMPVDGSNPAPAPAPPSPTPVQPPQPDADPILRQGSKGPAVAWVQKVLNEKTGGGVSVDEDFGPATDGRVREVQRVFNLNQDGVVGPATRGALQVLDSKPANPWGRSPFVDKPVLRQGSSGPYVSYLQAVIRDKSGGNITVDGSFGPKTRGRVLDFQAASGIAKDGAVGPDTWKALDRVAIS